MSFWNRVYPTYGNWGGPGWSGGTYPKTWRDTDWSVPATDSMDALFKEHDGYYQETIRLYEEKKISYSEMFTLQESADQILVKKAGGLSRDPRKWADPAASTWYAFVYRYLVLLLFYPKIWIM